MTKTQRGTNGLTTSDPTADGTVKWWYVSTQSKPFKYSHAIFFRQTHTKHASIHGDSGTLSVWEGDVQHEDDPYPCNGRVSARNIAYRVYPSVKWKCSKIDYQYGMSYTTQFIISIIQRGQASQYIIIEAWAPLTTHRTMVIEMGGVWWRSP